MDGTGNSLKRGKAENEHIRQGIALTALTGI
jgi:hypothetical protein